jgi:DMSO/TMAO reductase YedYZ molybdopterin-dependent catalytic subunit
MDRAVDQTSGPGRPVGRRLFLGLVGAGVVGLVWERFSLRDDDATVSDVAVSVPLTDAGQQDQREAREGVHPNQAPEGRFRYYSVGTVPSYTERTYRLNVGGEGVDGSLQLRYSDVKAFPNVAIRSTFRCVNGWRVKNNIWRGVRLRDVLDSAAPNSRAKHVTFYSGDGVYTESLTWKQARSDHALLVWELDGQPLIREQGWPLRLIYPDMYGYKSIKWLARMEVKSGRDLGFWEYNSGWEIDAYVYNPDQVQQG